MTIALEMLAFTEGVRSLPWLTQLSIRRYLQSGALDLEAGISPLYLESYVSNIQYYKKQNLENKVAFSK